ERYARMTEEQRTEYNRKRRASRLKRLRNLSEADQERVHAAVLVVNGKIKPAKRSAVAEDPEEAMLDLLRNLDEDSETLREIEIPDILNAMQQDEDDDEEYDGEEYDGEEYYDEDDIEEYDGEEEGEEVLERAGSKRARDDEEDESSKRARK
ncbi:hypothetical protein EBZ39_16010, partial [bacterium]|nr:hypothetical protein [bacterium]